MMTSDFSLEVKIRPFSACAMKNTQHNPYLWPNCQNFRVFQEIGVEEIGMWNTMVTSDLRVEVEIRPFHACTMHPAIIIGTVCSLWTWLWSRYHVPESVFLVYFIAVASAKPMTKIYMKLLRVISCV